MIQKKIIYVVDTYAKHFHSEYGLPATLFTKMKTDLLQQVGNAFEVTPEITCQCPSPGMVPTANGLPNICSTCKKAIMRQFK